jgi:hypothetical protein
MTIGDRASNWVLRHDELPWQQVPNVRHAAPGLHLARRDERRSNVTHRVLRYNKMTWQQITEANRGMERDMRHYILDRSQAPATIPPRIIHVGVDDVDAAGHELAVFFVGIPP